MKYLLVLLLLFCAVPALAQEPPTIIANAQAITVTDCTMPVSRSGHTHVYINYLDEKYQQAVMLVKLEVDDYCTVYRSSAWYHTGAGEATIVSGVIEYDDGGYTLLSGLPMVMDVAYLPAVMR